MKKIIFVAVVVVLVGIFILPFALPDTFQVEREIRIQQPPSMVFRYVSDFETWSEWSPWYTREPQAKISVSGTPGIVGSTSRWEGKVIGSGAQTLTKLVDPEYMETEIVFTAPQESVATGYWTFSEDGDGGCIVIWGIKGQLGYPIERYFGLFFDRVIGRDFEEGLYKLKSVLENKN